MIEVSLYLVSCTFLTLALIVLRAQPDSATNRSFATFTLFGTLCVLGVAAAQAGFRQRSAFAVESFLSSSLLALARYFPMPSGRPVRVLDEGAGTDPTARAKIFEPFFTTKPSGTGLELSICQEIADFRRARLPIFSRTVLGGTVAEVESPSLPIDTPPA